MTNFAKNYGTLRKTPKTLQLEKYIMKHEMCRTFSHLSQYCSVHVNMGISCFVKLVIFTTWFTFFAFLCFSVSVLFCIIRSFH